MRGRREPSKPEATSESDSATENQLMNHILRDLLLRDSDSGGSQSLDDMMDLTFSSRPVVLTIFRSLTSDLARTIIQDMSTSDPIRKPVADLHYLKKSEKYEKSKKDLVKLGILRIRDSICFLHPNFQKKMAKIFTHGYRIPFARVEEVEPSDQLDKWIDFYSAIAKGNSSNALANKVIKESQYEFLFHPMHNQILLVLKAILHNHSQGNKEKAAVIRKLFCLLNMSSARSRYALPFDEKSSQEHLGILEESDGRKQAEHKSGKVSSFMKHKETIRAVLKDLEKVGLVHQRYSKEENSWTFIIRPLFERVFMGSQKQIRPEYKFHLIVEKDFYVYAYFKENEPRMKEIIEGILEIFVDIRYRNSGMLIGKLRQRKDPEKEEKITEINQKPTLSEAPKSTVELFLRFLNENAHPEAIKFAQREIMLKTHSSSEQKPTKGADVVDKYPNLPPNISKHFIMNKFTQG